MLLQTTVLVYKFTDLNHIKFKKLLQFTLKLEVEFIDF